jgi:hypothetical protein
MAAEPGPPGELAAVMLAELLVWHLAGPAVHGAPLQLAGWLAGWLAQPDLQQYGHCLHQNMASSSRAAAGRMMSNVA